MSEKKIKLTPDIEKVLGYWGFGKDVQTPDLFMFIDALVKVQGMLIVKMEEEFPDFQMETFNLLASINNLREHLEILNSEAVKSA